MIRKALYTAGLSVAALVMAVNVAFAQTHTSKPFTGAKVNALGVKSLGGVAKDRVNMSITLPDTIRDIAKVQIYGAWAEAILGETVLNVPTTTSR